MYVRLNGASGLSGYRGLGDAYSDQLATIQNTLGPLMSSSAMSALMAVLNSSRQAVFGLSTIIGMAQNGNNNSGASATIANLANLLSQDPSFANVYYSGMKPIPGTNAYLFPNGDVIDCSLGTGVCIQDSRSYVGQTPPAVKNVGGLQVLYYDHSQSTAGPSGASYAVASSPASQSYVQPFMPSWAQTPAQAPAAPPAQPVYVPAAAPEMTAPAVQSNLMQAAPQNQLYQPSPLITPPSPAGPASAGALPAASTSTGSGVLDSAMSWISANPMLAAAGALGALFLFGGMGGRR